MSSEHADLQRNSDLYGMDQESNYGSCKNMKQLNPLLLSLKRISDVTGWIVEFSLVLV